LIKITLPIGLIGAGSVSLLVGSVIQIDSHKFFRKAGKVKSSSFETNDENKVEGITTNKFIPSTRIDEAYKLNKKGDSYDNINSVKIGDLVSYQRDEIVIYGIVEKHTKEYLIIKTYRTGADNVVRKHWTKLDKIIE
jgi:hypothetical protein